MTAAFKLQPGQPDRAESWAKLHDKEAILRLLATARYSRTITSSQVRLLVAVHERTAQRYLRELTEQGLLERVVMNGGHRCTQFAITQLGRDAL